MVIIVDDSLQPYDPDHENNAFYEDHWIGSENQGSRLIVTVPMLNKKDGSDPTNVEKEKHTFHFYLAENIDDDRASWDYKALDRLLTLSHPDPDNNPNNDPYENDVYYTDPDPAPAGTPYTGARFVLTVLTDDEIDDLVTAGTLTAAEADELKDLALLVRKAMDNDGTDNAIQNGVLLDRNGDGAVDHDPYKFRLFITSEDEAGKESDKVDFEIPRYYTLQGILESYAPKHEATFTLYSLKDNATDPLDPEEYAADAFLTQSVAENRGTGLWRQDFKLKSSLLMGDDKNGQIFKLIVTKPGHVTYTWVGLELTPNTLDTPTGLTFTLDTGVNGGMIALLGGDLDNDGGASTITDLGLMSALMSGEIPYTRESDPANAARWAISTFNPESLAYAADLDGNGKLGAPDLSIMNDKRNFRKRAEAYRDKMPQLINAGAGSLGGGSVVQCMLERFLFPEEYRWADDLLNSGKLLPAWASDLIDARRDIPDWVVNRIIAGQSVPSWVKNVLSLGYPIPSWAVQLALEGEALPQDVQDLIDAGKPLPETLPVIVVPEPVIPDLPAEPNTDSVYNMEDDTVVYPVPDETEAPSTEEAGDTAAEVETPSEDEAANETDDPENQDPIVPDNRPGDEVIEVPADKAAEESPDSDQDSGTALEATPEGPPTLAVPEEGTEPDIDAERYMENESAASEVPSDSGDEPVFPKELEAGEV